MKTKSVLVVSHSEDVTARLLMQRLSEIGQDHYLVDIGSYPDNSFATIDYSGNKPVCIFSGKGYSFTSEDVKSIWWRRPKGKVKVVETEAVGKYVSLESEVMMNSLFSFLGENAVWVSEPEKTRKANHKPLQLDLARKIGLRIPKTVISNDPNVIRNFIESNSNMPMIMKPVGTSFVRINDKGVGDDQQNLAIYTKLIDKNQILQNISMVANCPIMFQEAAEQEFDVRVTVVGEEVFSVKIGHNDSDKINSKNVDWRHHDLSRVFEPINIPAEIKDKCIELVSLLGLKFGALDFGYSKSKGYVFFEINPQGQWVPTEVKAGYPVSKTLARLLSEC